MLKLWRSKKERESGARSAVAGDGLSGDPSLVPIERPGRRHQPGDLHPSPQPSPIPGQAAASQQKQTEHQQEPPPAPTRQASSKERTPTKATAEWRRNQASARSYAPGLEAKVASPRGSSCLARSLFPLSCAQACSPPPLTVCLCPVCRQSWRPCARHRANTTMTRCHRSSRSSRQWTWRQSAQRRRQR